MLRELSGELLSNHRIMGDEEGVTPNFSQVGECSICDSHSIVCTCPSTKSIYQLSSMINVIDILIQYDQSARRQGPQDIASLG
jgi:hypothetical protein